MRRPSRFDEEPSGGGEPRAGGQDDDATIDSHLTPGLIPDPGESPDPSASDDSQTAPDTEGTPDSRKNQESGAATRSDHTGAPETAPGSDPAANSGVEEQETMDTVDIDAAVDSVLDRDSAVPDTPAREAASQNAPDQQAAAREAAPREVGRSPQEPLPAGSPTAALPESIGPYPIQKELGRGGMGVVYLARDPRLERPIALKLLPERIADDPAAFARFQDEAKLLASINHPNIATIYSLEEAESLQFLTMEMIRGQTLSDRLAGKTLSVEEWLPICRQIAVALEAAHRNGVVHLDLKPQNVMVNEDGLAKVLDFGLALALGTETGPAGEVRTKSRAQIGVSGTPGYMSPEQLRNEAVDSRSDIWAFGCILYECASGKSAFPGPTLRDRIVATLRATPDLDALPKDTPPRVRDLLELCLKPDVDERLGSITKARQGIEETIALRSLPAAEVRRETVPNNLPSNLSSFIGRERQKAEVSKLLTQNRLVTLTGVGGGGKTRLSIEVARERLASAPDGVWRLEMASLADPALVPQTLTSVLGLRDQGSQPAAQLVADHLKEKSSLLVLDNCEHLLEAVARLASTLLATCAQLKILATSREPLGVAGEVSYQVPSMPVPLTDRPQTLDEFAGAESVQLFAVRAAQVSPSFELTRDNARFVAQICRRLDGIPLAIELAAARIKVLPPQEIAKRLDDRFRLLGSSRADLPHHKTLRALIDWSYDHLEESEQLLLRRLSLFAGGWTLEAVEAVCAGDGIEEWEILDLLSSLVDKSLVEADAQAGQETGRARYRMLETIREYSREKLRAGEEGADVLVRHRDYFLELAEESEPLLTGPEQSKVIARLAAEHDNLRLALDLSSVPTADPELGWRLGGALGRYFYIRGHWTEGRSVYTELMAREDAVRETAAAANALNWAGNLAKLQGDVEEARRNLEESLAIRRKLGNQEGIASSLNNLGTVAEDRGDYDQARTLYEESLEIRRTLGDRVGISHSLNNLGIVSHRLGDHRRSLELLEESLGIRRELGDHWGVAGSLINLAEIARALSDYDRAAAFLDECLSIHRKMGDPHGIGPFLKNTMGRVAEERGDLEGARAAYEEALAAFRELGDRRYVAVTLNNLGTVLATQGKLAEASGLLAESLSIVQELQDASTAAKLLNSFAFLALESGDAARAARLFGAAEAGRERTGTRLEALEEARLQNHLSRLRSSLEGNILDSEWAIGRSLTPAQAIDLASEGWNPSGRM
jgi:predicted ATPase